MRNILLAILCLLLTPLFGHAGPRLPDTIILSPQVLYDTKQKVIKRDSSTRPAYEKLILEANRVVDGPVESPALKKKAGPSGDKQDYWSLSPYWWPDPKTRDGLPYVRRDGERNPEATTDTYDRLRMNRMAKNALTLALAYYLTGNEEYAAKGTALIWAWCCDSATRMNPNMQYAQARPGVADGHPTGIIETRDLINVVDAARLLEPSHAWSKAVTRKLTDWFTKYTHWLMKSEFGRLEAGSPNNHGTWYDAQLAVYAYFIGDTNLARTILSTVPNRRIVRQILPDGSMPLELERPRSRHYTFFNLQAFAVLACVGERLNIDLWNWQSPAGPSIRTALDFTAPFINPRTKWVHGKTGSFDPYSYLPLFRRAAVVYKNLRYVDFLKTLPAERLKRDRSTLFY